MNKKKGQKEERWKDIRRRTKERKKEKTNERKKQRNNVTNKER